MPEQGESTRGGSKKKSKPKVSNPPRTAEELRAYAKGFLDWALDCNRTMNDGAYRLEEFDRDFQVVLITSMIDKFRDQIAKRVTNQFGKAGKLTDDIDKERARRELDRILSRKRGE